MRSGRSTTPTRRVRRWRWSRLLDGWRAADQATGGAKYLTILLHPKMVIVEAGAQIAEHMQKLVTSTLNVAGNGIYTLAAKTNGPQAQINQTIYGVLAAAHAIHPITKIY